MDGTEGDSGSTPKLRSDGNKLKPVTVDAPVNQLKSIVVLLAEMVITMVNQQGGVVDADSVKELKGQVDQRGLKVQELSQIVTRQRDEVDDIRQRGMKGNLLISSSNTGPKESLIKNDE